jgi:hypothetical protein
MRKLLLHLVFLWIFSTNFIIAQDAHPPQLNELILGIPSISARTYDDVKNKLSSMGGLVLVGYCDQYKCFLIKYDANKIENPDVIAKTLEDYNSMYKTEVKIDASIAKLISSCVKLTTENEMETE